MSHRLGVFKQNKQEVENFKKQNPNATFKVALNKFFDWTDEEKSKLTGYVPASVKGDRRLGKAAPDPAPTCNAN